MWVLLSTYVMYSFLGARAHLSDAVDTNRNRGELLIDAAIEASLHVGADIGSKEKNTFQTRNFNPCAGGL